MNSAKRTLLIIDDERSFCDAVREYVGSEHLAVLAAHTSAAGLQICSTHKVDVVLLDQKLPDGEGHKLAPAILEKNEQTKIIFITAFPSFENAVAAVRMGAYDYLSKPVDPQELRLMIGNALRTLALEQLESIQNYTREKERDAAVLIGSSAAFSEVLHIVDRAAAAEAPVLLTGETGTGKNLIARTIHYKGPLARGAFISINCSALPESLIEAELFGYERGAFTGAASAKKGLFEMADGGTLFLDEIGDMPVHLQSKLLSVIEDRVVRRIGSTAVRPISVRIIAATNAELEKAIGRTFRKDLYFRLGVIRIHVPPLREHRDDIPVLSSYLLEHITQGKITGLPEDEQEKLMAYDWPGNVRELRNVLDRAIFLQKGSELHPSQLLALPENTARQDRQGSGGPVTIKTLEQCEREHIQFALAELSGNVTRTAKMLGISLSTLKRKIKEYDLHTKTGDHGAQNAGNIEMGI